MQRGKSSVLGDASDRRIQYNVICVIGLLRLNSRVCRAERARYPYWARAGCAGLCGGDMNRKFDWGVAMLVATTPVAAAFITSPAG